MLIFYINGSYFSNRNIENFEELRTVNMNEKYNIEHAKELEKYKKSLGISNDSVNNSVNDNNKELGISNNSVNDSQKHKIKDAPSIINPISDAYLPYSSNVIDYNNMQTPENINNEYAIINIYKTLLDRQPDNNEINKYLYLYSTNELNDDTLKLQILNSPEYTRLIKMQSNEVEPGLISAIAKEDLLSKLSKLYYNEKKIVAPKSMLLPLRDCYIHLQYNDFLFRSMLVHNNYNKFEKEVLDTPLLSKENLLKIFNKYFLLIDLKYIANDIRKKELLDMKNSSGVIPKPITNNVGNNIDNKDTNIENQLNKIVDQSNSIFNKDDVAKLLKKNNYKSDLYVRVYEPIKYQQDYKGDPLFRPPICTTLGQKQLIQPVFENSKTLFQGTDLKESIENTQVGSIMPKFEYKEYQDINVI